MSQEEVKEVLQVCQDLHLVLQERPRSVGIWSSGKRIPKWLRQAIRQHNREILAMIGKSDPLTCPTRELHHYSDEYLVHRRACRYCAQLRPWTLWNMPQSTDEKRAG
jgi:hypothetical protein